MLTTYGNMTNRVFAVAMRAENAASVAWALIACVLWPDSTAKQNAGDDAMFSKAVRNGIVFG